MHVGRRLMALLALCCIALCTPMRALADNEAAPQRVTIAAGDGVYDLTALEKNKALMRLTLDHAQIANAQALSGQTAHPYVVVKRMDALQAAQVLIALKDDWFCLELQDMALGGELMDALSDCKRLTELSLTRVSAPSLSALKGLKKLNAVTLDDCDIADMASLKAVGYVQFPSYFALTIKRAPEGTDFSFLYELKSTLDFVTVLGYDVDSQFDTKKVKAANVRYISLSAEK